MFFCGYFNPGDFPQGYTVFDCGKKLISYLHLEYVFWCSSAGLQYSTRSMLQVPGQRLSVKTVLTVVMEHTEEMAQRQKQPVDTREEKYDAEMLT